MIITSVQPDVSSPCRFVECRVTSNAVCRLHTSVSTTSTHLLPLESSVNNNNNNNDNGLQIRGREILRTCPRLQGCCWWRGITGARLPGSAEEGEAKQGPMLWTRLRAPAAPQWCPPSLPSVLRSQQYPHRSRTVNVCAASDLWRMKLKLDGNELSYRLPTCRSYTRVSNSA